MSAALAETAADGEASRCVLSECGSGPKLDGAAGMSPPMSMSRRVSHAPRIVPCGEMCSDSGGEQPHASWKSTVDSSLGTGPVAGMKKRQANSRVLALVAAALLMASMSTAQSDPCYCIMQVHFDWWSLTWIVDECGGNCLPGEGVCRTSSTFLQDGTEVWACACRQADGSYRKPNCYCSGSVVNPGFESSQQPSRVDCSALQACPVETHKCSSAHLLAFPGAPVAICRCQ